MLDLNSQLPRPARSNHIGAMVTEATDPFGLEALRSEEIRDQLLEFLVVERREISDRCLVTEGHGGRIGLERRPL